MQQFKQDLDNLKPVIVDITDHYTLYKEILSEILNVSDDVLTKIKDNDGLLGSLEKVNEKIKETEVQLTSFKDIIESNATTFNDSISDFAVSIDVTKRGMGKLFSAVDAGTKIMKTYATTVKKLSKETEKKTPGGKDSKKDKKEKGFGDFAGFTGKLGGLVRILSEVGKVVWAMAGAALDGVAKVQGAVRPLNAQMGLGYEQLNKFTLTMGNAAEETMAHFGIGLEDLAKMQGEIFTKLGRTQKMSFDQAQGMAALAKLPGMGVEGAAEYASQMDKVGMSMTTAEKTMNRIMTVSSKAGVPMVDATKLVSANIQKAQSYGFKGGVDGLTRMAVQSMRLRMSMEQAFKFSDMNRTVEGAVTQAAKAQVLGGSFSGAADPLANLYNSLNDQEAIFKQISDIGKDQMKWDASKGMMDFKSTFNREASRAYAQSQGLDFDELTKGWSQAGKMEQVKRGQIGAAGAFSGKTSDQITEMRESIASQANWNEKKGGFTVTVDSGVDSKGRMITEEKRVDQLTADDIANIVPDTTEKDVRQIAASTRSAQQTLENIRDSLKIAADVWSTKTFGKGMDDMAKQLGLMRDSAPQGAKVAGGFLANSWQAVTGAVSALLLKPLAKRFMTRWAPNIQKRLTRGGGGTPRTGGGGNGFFSKMGNAFKSGARGIGNALKVGARGIGNAARGIGNGAKLLGRGIGNGAKLLGNAFKSGARAIGNALKVGARAIGNVAKVIGNALKVGARGIGNAAKLLGRGIGSGARGLGNVAKVVGRGVLNNAPKILNALKGVGGAALKMLGKSGPLAVVGGVIEGAIATTKSKEWGVGKGSAFVGGFLGGTGERKTTTQKVVGAGMGAMKGAAIGAMIGSVIPGAGTVIGGAIGGVIGGIGGLLGPKIVAKGMDAVASFGKKVFKYSPVGMAISAGQGVAKFVGNFLSKEKNRDKIKGLGSDMWKGAKKGALLGPIGMFTGAMGGAIKNLTKDTKFGKWVEEQKGNFNNFVKNTKLGQFWGTMTKGHEIIKKNGGYWKSLTEQINKSGGVMGFLGDTFGRMRKEGEKTGGALGAITGFFGGIFDMVNSGWQSLKETWEAIKNFDFGAWLGGIWKDFTDFWPKLGNWIKSGFKTEAFALETPEVVKPKSTLHGGALMVNDAAVPPGESKLITDGSRKLITSAEDMVMAVKPGGTLSRFFTSGVAQSSPMGGGTGNIRIPPIKLEISGTLNLNANGTNIDITSVLRDRQFISLLTDSINIEMNRKRNRGVVSNASMVQQGNFV
jgi:hypothetical protein